MRERKREREREFPAQELTFFYEKSGQGVRKAKNVLPNLRGEIKPH